MHYRGDHGVVLGDRLWISGDVRPPREGSEEFWQDRGVLGSVMLDQPPVHVEHGALIWWIGNRLRRSFQAFVSGALPGADRSVVEALCFNQDADMTDALRDSLQRTGTVHIVSTSGLHVVFLAGVVLWLLSWLPIPRWAQLFLLACALLVYASASGLRPPAVRAVVMVVVFLSAYLAMREPDALSAMGAAFLVSFLWNPSSILESGLQLSFVTLGALVLFADIRREPARGPRAWFTSAAKATARSSLIASAASAPLTAYYFGYLSIVSVLANVMIFPAVLGIMVFSLGSYMLGFAASAPAALALKLLAAPLASYLRWTVETVSAIPWAALYTPPFSGYWLPLVYLLGLMVWRPRARPE